MRRRNRAGERGGERGRRAAAHTSRAVPATALPAAVPLAAVPLASPGAPLPGRRRRDRRGRGLRGRVAPADVPLHRTRAEEFDELVMDAVDELAEQWGPDLDPLEFAVEDVPPVGSRAAEPDADTVLDRGVALGRLFRAGLDDIAGPVVVIYRRPLEARAVDPEDRADLVFMVVVDLVAEFLGRDADEIDPPH